MNLMDKNVHLPSFVPGATLDERIENAVRVMVEVSSSRERHLMRFSKKKRIKKKYCDRLLERALGEIFFRKLRDFLESLEGQDKFSFFVE